MLHSRTPEHCTLRQDAGAARPLAESLGPPASSTAQHSRAAAPHGSGNREREQGAGGGPRPRRAAIRAPRSAMCALTARAAAPDRHRAPPRPAGRRPALPAPLSGLAALPLPGRAGRGPARAPTCCGADPPPPAPATPRAPA